MRQNQALKQRIRERTRVEATSSSGRACCLICRGRPTQGIGIVKFVIELKSFSSFLRDLLNL